MFETTYETRYGDYKDFDTIKISSILDMIQDVSTRNSQACGYGMDKLREMNLAWLLKGITIKLEAPVRTHCPITVKTAIKPFKGATSHRGCIVMQEGKVVAKTIAEWFVFDNIKKRPCRIPEEMAKAYEIHDFDDDFFNYIKPKTQNIEESAYTIRVSNKEIDTNMHMNNQKSAELLMDALPFDYRFTTATILYRKPAVLGDELEVCVNKTENGYYVHLQTKNKEISVVGTFE